jgi:hypothetical protein
LPPVICAGTGNDALPDINMSPACVLADIVD